MNFSRNRIPDYAAIALRLALGVVFLYAAWPKLTQSWLLFAMDIDAYQVLPHWGVVFVARTLPWGELLLGLWLISGKWLRMPALGASLLLSSFFVLLVRAYLKDMQINCGCFGSGDIISLRTLLRDGALLAASLVLVALAFRGASAKAP
ncbi:MAG: MauE/DoxX family redox-associated membrane protein [Bryobacteraceae bacterium]